MSTTANTPRPPATRPTDVYLFGTCVLDLFDPEAGVSAVELLESEGVRVHYPQGQSCCGQPAYTSGFPAEAREVAAAQLALFPGLWPVVVPSGSCAGMLRHHWPRLFADDLTHLPRAESIASRTYELVVPRPNPGSACVVDGQPVSSLEAGDVVRVRRAEPRFTLVETARHGYYRTLRDKLGWGGGLRAAEPVPPRGTP